MELTKSERDKLEHAIYRGAKQMYCGDENDKDLISLVEKGMMRGPLRSGILPEGYAYFKATIIGVEAVH